MMGGFATLHYRVIPPLRKVVYRRSFRDKFVALNVTITNATPRLRPRNRLRPLHAQRRQLATQRRQLTRKFPLFELGLGLEDATDAQRFHFHSGLCATRAARRSRATCSGGGVASTSVMVNAGHAEAQGQVQGQVQPKRQVQAQARRELPAPRSMPISMAIMLMLMLMLCRRWCWCRRNVREWGTQFLMAVEVSVAMQMGMGMGMGWRCRCRQNGSGQWDVDNFRPRC